MILPGINQRVEVTVEGQNSSGSPFTCWVQDVDRDLLTLAAPMKQGYFVHIPVGAGVSVLFSNERRLYFLFGSVQGYESEPPVIIVKMEDESRILQRREHFRWSANLAVEYAHLDPGSSREPEEIPPQEWRKATTTDISAGGLQLVGRERMEPGRILWLKVFLPCLEAPAQGEVIRAAGLENGSIHFAGIMFTRITQAMQDAIVRYIYQQEILERRKDKNLRD